MIDQAETPLVLTEDRFERFTRIQWWDEQRMRAARILVIGAGALGNEVVKNLSLLGVGHVAVADMDCIERSNLSRSVLFRTSDEGRPKAQVAAEVAAGLYPDIDAVPLVGNILGDVGLGWFRWADVVIGALDNREARVFVNSSCAKVGRTWIDGGIEVLNGIVRAFAPPKTACYECTMGQTDWDELNRRRSCSLLARNAAAEGGTPTTPTTASVIGAIQAQEAVKFLHDLETLAGTGFVFEGLSHQSYPVSYPINPDCPWHEPPPPIEAVEHFGLHTPLADVWQYGREKLGELDAIDLSREVVTALRCPSCDVARDSFQPIHRITEAEAVCGECGTECLADFAHSLAADSPWLTMTVSEFGLPAWDIVWARRDETVLGIELAADRHVARDSMPATNCEEVTE